jgi:hypothetical protein
LELAVGLWFAHLFFGDLSRVGSGSSLYDKLSFNGIALAEVKSPADGPAGAQIADAPRVRFGSEADTDRAPKMVYRGGAATDHELQRLHL